MNDPYGRDNTDLHPVPLRFGQFVQATVSGTQAQTLIVIPRSLLRLEGSVLVVSEDNTLSIRNVKVARSNPQSVYISEGLQSGDKVIRSAVPNPFDGMPLRITGEDPAKDDVADEPAALSTGE